MTTDQQNLRIEGIYRQRQDGYYMQRVKLPAGVISSEQARCVAAVAERYGRSSLHLTSRGSIEVHWLEGDALPVVKQEFARVGLTSRGACGGAVRGITCSAQGVESFPAIESLARRLQRHFTGNPRYERLPKKFKIGIEAETTGGRHLIQDVGLVLAGTENGTPLYDVWIAGGLGREPQPGFLLAEQMREERIIPVIEAVIAVYARLAPPPKRLKFLATEHGAAALCRLIEAEPAFNEELPPQHGFPDHLSPSFAAGQRLVLPVFAGQLSSAELRQLADFADEQANGILQVTADQDIAFVRAGTMNADHAPLQLMCPEKTSPVAVTFRICPGNHECRMGLAATREVAGAVLAAMPVAAQKQVWALSGCPNSCSQPQLADIGIVASRLGAGENGDKIPRFDLYRRTDTGFGRKIREQLTLEELLETVRSATADFLRNALPAEP